jgi:hypothetical protein
MEFTGKLHDYSHTFEGVQEWGKMSREKGLNAALAWRDGKYGDDFRALRKMAAEKGTDYPFPQALSMPEVREGLDKYEEERKKEG